MSDPITTILGGVVIAFVSGSTGAFIGSRKKVNSDTCNERRKSCQELIAQKLSAIDAKVDKIIKALEYNNILVI